MFVNALYALVIFIIIAALIVGGFLFYVYYWLVQRPVPNLDGVVELDCLDQPVEIQRDKHGVPHIYAKSRADLFRAQGYVHAQDRLWQMEQNRRIGQGTLAEVFGIAALEADRYSRIIGFRRAAQAELDALDPDTQSVLAWYAEGVNAYMTQRAGRLAAEFNLLRYRPEPWAALDSVTYAKVMSWSLSVNWESELTRLQLQRQLGAIRAAELEPDYPKSNPVTLEAVGDYASNRALATAGLILNEYEKIKHLVGAQGVSKGSNSWVLAPKKSTTRRPIFCNDPHLALQIPGTWYEVHLSCPELNVSGATLAGTPGVVIGHNEQIAWGLTNAFVDVQDLYWERRHPDNPLLFEYDGEWEEAQVIEEEIRIRRQREPHIERVVITRNGPLFSEFAATATGEQADAPAPLSLRWTGHDPGTTTRAVLQLNLAENWEDFRSALREWTAPAQNITYADVQGNIGYCLAGAIPQRSENLGLLPAAGWDPAYQWERWIAPEELPSVYNPASGMIVSANNKIVGDDYPYFLGAEYLPGWRAARIEEVLKEKDRLTMRDMEELQVDTRSKFAEKLAPWIAQVESDDPYEKVALAALRRWDFHLDPDSVGALVFHYTWLYLLEAVFGQKLGDNRNAYLGISSSPLFLIHGFYLRSSSRLVELLEENDESVWYGDGTKVMPRDAVLRTAVTRAVQHIRRDLGDNATKWQWGRVHQVRYAHPMGSVRLFRSMFNRGPFPVGGDATTPNNTGYPARIPPGLVQTTASIRQIYEVGVWDRSRTVTTSGQSGHPLSPHYDDQIPMWREGVYHAMPWTKPEVDNATIYRLSLQPKGKGN